MPIKPENRAKYGPNWKLIRSVIIARERPVSPSAWRPRLELE